MKKLQFKTPCWVKNIQKKIEPYIMQFDEWRKKLARNAQIRYDLNHYGKKEQKHGINV